MLIYFPLSFNINFEKGDILTRKKRIHTLDEIRGFCVFCMVFDHCLFTHGYMFGSRTSRNLFDFFEHISPAFAAVFILICGISCGLSRSNFQRSLKILGAALVVSAVTLVIMPEMPIVFGILHLLGTCVLIYALLGRWISKIPAPVGICLCLLLFIFTYNVDLENATNGFLGIGPLKLELPESLYESNNLLILGFRAPMKAYSDYFPLLPWAFPFLAGTFLGKFAKEERFPKFMYKARVPFFSTLGTNAFFVYLVHQPLAYGVFYLISLFGGN